MAGCGVADAGWATLLAAMYYAVTKYRPGSVWFCARASKAQDKIGSIGYWSFVGLLSLNYLGNIFRPPPPSGNTVTITGVFCLPLFLWVWWFDRHRDFPPGTG
ncbi:MAG: hypothetical protein WCS70_00890 [Verrucomicrobiota bacterium]